MLCGGLRVQSPDGQRKEALPQSLCSGQAGAEGLARGQPLEKALVVHHLLWISRRVGSADLVLNSAQQITLESSPGHGQVVILQLSTDSSTDSCFWVEGPLEHCGDL